MLDATRLRVLVAVARSGSVTAAAHALNYAQPSISHHIARLEAETGAKLIERAGRGVRLTDAGQLLAERAEEILGRLDAAEAELATHLGLRQDRVRLAAFGSALATVVADAAAELHSEHPGYGLHLSQAEPGQALRMLKAGEADIAVVYRYLRDGSAIDSPLIETKDPLHDNFSHGQLMLDEPVYLITPVELPEAGQADAGPGPADPAGNEADARAAILAGRKSRSWIATGEQCGDLLPDLGRAAGFTPNITMRTHDNVAAQALVAAGLGVALVPGLALRAARPARIRATELPGIKREILALTYPGAADAPAVNRLVEALGRAQVEDS